MTFNLRSITRKSFFSSLGSKEKKWQDNYLAMYSSWLRGIVTDPALMLIPADDHLVHRGDGVFDVMRCINGRIYQMESHLKRLELSARVISLNLPPEYDKVRDIIKSLVLIGGEKDCIIRIIISRGPGGFSTNPFECPSSQLYINIIRYKKMPDKDYREGVSLVLSRVPVKKSFFATIKSCNYLQNVLMKMEAINAGHKYSVNIDDDGFIGEGSKTVLPAKAMAKISMRLVPDQRPDQIEKSLRAYLNQHVPQGITWELEDLSSCIPGIIDRESEAVKAASRALESVWGKAPLFKREGGSVPVVGMIKELLGVNSLMLGFGLPDDNLHAPNEKFHLPNFYRGIETFIRFMYEIA